jgi:hypothetical protein
LHAATPLSDAPEIKAGEMLAEMKERGDNRVPCKEDLQIEFRQIQKARAPELDTLEWLHLFGLWYDDYSAGIEARRRKAFDDISAFGACEAPKHPGSPFICPTTEGLSLF